MLSIGVNFKTKDELERLKEPLRLENVIRNHILKVFEDNSRQPVRTARILGISRSTLYRKLSEYEVVIDN